MKSNIKPLCKSNGWILDQKKNYRKCYKTTKFSLSDAKMEYSVVELRRNSLRNSGLVTIAISFIVAIISKVNIDIMNGIVSINLKNYETLTTLILVISMLVLYGITMYFCYNLKKHKIYYLLFYIVLLLVVLVLTIGIETSNALIAIFIFIFSLLVLLFPIAYFIYYKVIDYNARLIILDEIIDELKNK